MERTRPHSRSSASSDSSSDFRGRPVASPVTAAPDPFATSPALVDGHGGRRRGQVPIKLGRAQQQAQAAHAYVAPSLAAPPKKRDSALTLRERKQRAEAERRRQEMAHEQQGRGRAAGVAASGGRAGAAGSVGSTASLALPPRYPVRALSGPPAHPPALMISQQQGLVPRALAKAPPASVRASSLGAGVGVGIVGSGRRRKYRR